MITTCALDSPRAHRNALWSAHLAALLFGMTGLLGALIEANALVITSGRAMFAIAALGFFAKVLRRPVIRGLTWRKSGALVLSGIFLTTHWVSFFIAVKVGGVAVATLGFASFPAFIAALDKLIFRTPIGAFEGLMLLLVTVGLILVVPTFDFSDSGTLGLLWGLGSGLSFASLAITNQRGTKGMDAMQVSLWQNMTVLTLVGPILLLGQEMPALQSADWLFIGVLGVVRTALSQFLFIKSLDSLEARSAGMIIALEPVYAIAGAWLVFAEQPSSRMLAGAALIILATLVSTRSKAGETLH